MSLPLPAVTPPAQLAPTSAACQSAYTTPEGVPGAATLHGCFYGCFLLQQLRFSEQFVFFTRVGRVSVFIIVTIFFHFPPHITLALPNMETASELFDANDVRNAVMPMPMPTPPITPPISPSSRDSFSRGHGGSSGSPNGDTQNHTREDPLGGPSPDKIAFEYRASTGLVWKRWFW